MTQRTDDADLGPLLTDDQILERAGALIGRAGRRQLWIFFIDQEGRQLPVVVPIVDYPVSPDGGHAERLAAHIGRLVDGAGADRVVFVWERDLPAKATPADRAWSGALDDACWRAGIVVRGQLISHRGGVRWFSPDDYA